MKFLFMTTIIFNLLTGCDFYGCGCTYMELTDLNVDGAAINASGRYEFPADGESFIEITIRAKIYDENVKAGRKVYFEIVEDDGKKGSFSNVEQLGAIDVKTVDGGLATTRFYSSLTEGNVDIKITYEEDGKATMIIPIYLGERQRGNKLSQFEINCDQKSVMAFNELIYQGKTEIKIRCEITTKNRKGEPVQVPESSILFKSEVGKLVYDGPLIDGEGDHIGGYVYYYVLNREKLNDPETLKNLDVKPLIDPEEPFYVDQSGAIRNPRDGLVTIMVYADGEEYLIDQNMNGQYDLGEDFYDQGEPFHDANDSGKWEEGEYFFDENSNGKYDGPNNHWDEVGKKIFASTKILLTGKPHHSTDTTGLICPPEYQAGIPCGEEITLQYRLVDQNLNPVAIDSGLLSTTVIAGDIVLSGDIDQRLNDGYGISLDGAGRITGFLREGVTSFPISFKNGASICNDTEEIYPFSFSIDLNGSINPGNLPLNESTTFSHKFVE